MAKKSKEKPVKENKRKERFMTIYEASARWVSSEEQRGRAGADRDREHYDSQIKTLEGYNSTGIYDSEIRQLKQLRDGVYY